MKKSIIAIIAGLVLLTSCSNDDINTSNANDVNVTVSLSNFFSSYNFQDTQHNRDIANMFATFHSESDMYIHARTYFYDSKGNLADSVVSFVTSTNAISKTIKLAEGTYTAISTLSFAKEASCDESYWQVVDRNKLHSAYLDLGWRGNQWLIMSYEAKTFTVVGGEVTNLSMTPKPIGALAYMYIQNFQYKNQASFGTVGDNKVREIAFYTKNNAHGYKMDPNASEKYIYYDDGGASSWYYLSDDMHPSDFANSDTYGYFRTNLYDYFYVLAPKFTGCFGYSLEGESGFNAYGQNTYTIKDGVTQLAYWDWFQVGNPYFGKADNNHWNTYSASARRFGVFDFTDEVEDENLNQTKKIRY